MANNNYNNALEKVATKILENVADTGEITDNQMALLLMYSKTQKSNSIDLISRYGKEILNITNKIFPINGGK